LSDLLDLKNGVFWVVVTTFLGLVLLYICLFIFDVLKIAQRYSDLYVVQILHDFTVILLPVVGHMLFMPTIAVLSSVFICYETSGDDVDDAFMDKDCY
jgi:hypothetical protein